MKGIIAIAFVACIGVAVAYPSSQWGRSQRVAESDEGEYYPRSRSVSPRIPPQSPYYFYKSSPRFVRYNSDVEASSVGPQYRLYRQPRDDDESDEEDDVNDDEGGDDDDDDIQDDGFDTPTWEKLFPREQQGSYGQASSGNAGGPPPPGASQGQGFEQPQQDSGSYEIQSNGPGGPNWSSGIEGQGRSQFVFKKPYRPAFRSYVPVKKSSGPRWVVPSSPRYQWSHHPSRTSHHHVPSSNRRWSQSSYQPIDSYWTYPSSSSRRSVWGRPRGGNKRSFEKWGYY